jgi:DNA (cytosine-5)-methyltransferase 1
MIEILEKILLESKTETENQYAETIIKNIDILIEYIDSYKSVISVLITSLLKKIIDPEQDIRLHRTGFKGGYSARSLDTNATAPFFKKHFPKYANKESGFLTMATREQIKWTLDEGEELKIRNKNVKSSFLTILDSIENNYIEPYTTLTYIFQKLTELSKHQKLVFDDIINASKYLDVINIHKIIEMLNKHFSTKLSSRLPVIAVYSIYQMLSLQLKQYENKILLPLSVHTSADKHRFGDIDIWNNDDTPYEIIEIKHNIPIERNMIFDIVKKTKNTNIEKYYLLTTATNNFISVTEENYINNFVLKIKKENNMEIIPNGIFNSIKYYLRFIDDYKKFIYTYTENLVKDSQNSTEVKEFHITEWKEILKKHNL